MKIKVLQESFSGALAIASRFINPRVQLPILGNILLKTEKTKLIVASTNLEVSASITIGAQIEKEGEITIPGKVIAEVIANLPKETITLEGEMEQLKIKTGSFSSSVLGMNSADFPSFPFTLPKKETINLSRKDISEALSLVLFASSTDETRPTLTGVLFIFEKGNLTLVAADG
ncbi:DNA polymerase III subunit beta, partial [Candidatus Woesebacteria bacterium]|nr:DNA polymerase III subunit beta [Candidatus Woesebacteria bacterium]